MGKHETPELLEALKEALSYDPSTGLLTWKKAGPGRAMAKLAGWVDLVSQRKKLAFRIAGAKFNILQHRIAWALHYGEWPRLQIDHINGSAADNRITNLRQATHAQNQHNRKGQSRCGLPKGVTKNNSGYQARIGYENAQLHLGNFKTPQEAHAAYRAAAKLLHGEYARAA